MKTFSYRNLIVWQKSIDLAEKIYRLTEGFPKNEEYNLKSQMRRSVTSVGLNIAEGSARIGNRDQGRFYIIARASLVELDAQLYLGKRLEVKTNLGDQDTEVIMHEIYKMLTSLINSTRNR